MPSTGVFFESSVVRFHCQEGYRLKGPSQKLCERHFNGSLSWKPSDKSVCLQEGKSNLLLANFICKKPSIVVCLCFWIMRLCYNFCENFKTIFILILIFTKKEVASLSPIKICLSFDTRNQNSLNTLSTNRS